MASSGGPTGTGGGGDDGASSLQKSANLSDVSSIETVHENLDLGSAAQSDADAFEPAGSVEQLRTTTLQNTNNLSDVSDAATARTNLDLGSAALNNTADFEWAGTAAETAAGMLEAANNLSDVADPSAARSNLDLGSAALADSSAFDSAGAASSVQSFSLQKSADLSDVADAPTARTNLGLGTAATQPATAFDAAGSAANAAATVQGNSLQKSSNLADVPNPIAAQTNLGLGSAATQAISAFDSAGAASSAVAIEKARAQAQEVLALLKSNNLSDLTNVATARVNLGLGSAATQASSAFDTAGTAANAVSALGSAAQQPSSAFDAAGAAAAVQAVLAPQIAANVPTSRTLWAQTGAKTVANSTTEASILGSGVGSLVLPANYLTVGKTLRLKLRGLYSTGALSVGTITMRGKLTSGSGTITTLVSGVAGSLIGSAANWGLDSELIVTCLSTGTSGTMMVMGVVNYSLGATTAPDSVALNNGSAPITVDTTQTQTFSSTVQWSASLSANSISSMVATLEALG